MVLVMDLSLVLEDLGKEVLGADEVHYRDELAEALG
jgi:hypothetical protein